MSAVLPSAQAGSTPIPFLDDKSKLPEGQSLKKTSKNLPFVLSTHFLKNKVTQQRDLILLRLNGSTLEDLNMRYVQGESADVHSKVCKAVQLAVQPTSRPRDLSLKTSPPLERISGCVLSNIASFLSPKDTVSLIHTSSSFAKRSTAQELLHTHIHPYATTILRSIAKKDPLEFCLPGALLTHTDSVRSLDLQLPRHLVSPRFIAELVTHFPHLQLLHFLVDNLEQANTLLSIRASKKVDSLAHEELILKFSQNLKSFVCSGCATDPSSLDVLFDILIDLVAVQGYKSKLSEILGELKDCFMPTSKFRMPTDVLYLCSFSQTLKKIAPKTTSTLSAATHTKALKTCETLSQKKEYAAILRYAIPAIANYKELHATDQKLVAQLIYNHYQEYIDHLELLFDSIIKERMPSELRFIFLNDLCARAKIDPTIADRKGAEALAKLSEFSTYREALDDSMIDTVLNVLIGVAKQSTMTNRRLAIEGLIKWVWSSPINQKSIIQHEKTAITSLVALLDDKTLTEDMQRNITRLFGKLSSQNRTQPLFEFLFQLYCDLLTSPQMPTAIKLQLICFMPVFDSENDAIELSALHEHKLFSLMISELDCERNPPELKRAYVTRMAHTFPLPEAQRLICQTYKWQSLPEGLLTVPAIKRGSSLTAIVMSAYRGLLNRLAKKNSSMESTEKAMNALKIESEKS